MKNSIAFLFVLISSLIQAFVVAQKQDTIYINRKTEYLDEVIIHRTNSNYNYELNRVRKLYPYALQVAAMLDEYDKELGIISKKRKQKTYSKNAHKQLKDEYTYVIKDLYRSEGILLMKLIHRETGLTVKEIIAQYRGKFNAGVYDKLAGIWDQNLGVKYDPTGEDKLIELIVKEIENEQIEFDNTPKMVTKEEYKVNMKEYRNDKKEYRKEKKRSKK